MEQSAVVKMLEAMLATLVEQVTAAVTLQLDTLIGARFADARAELEETIAARTSLKLEEIEDCITTWAQDNLDVEGDVQRYVDNYFDINDHLDIGEKISEALDEIDWKEKINETLSGATIRLE
jgi:hypothetical protein